MLIISVCNVDCQCAYHKFSLLLQIQTPYNSLTEVIFLLGDNTIIFQSLHILIQSSLLLLVTKWESQLCKHFHYSMHVITPCMLQACTELVKFHSLSMILDNSLLEKHFWFRNALRFSLPVHWCHVNNLQGTELLLSVIALFLFLLLFWLYSSSKGINIASFSEMILFKGWEHSVMNKWILTYYIIVICYLPVNLS